MNQELYSDAKAIYTEAINASLPDSAVRTALAGLPHFKGRLVLVAIGKAAYRMAAAAHAVLGERIDRGIVITKYGHAEKALDRIEIYEAGHPVPDENGLLAAERALDMTSGLSPDDLVLFLVSGGGSALFELVDFPLSDLTRITSELLGRGASIEEMNTVRKHLSRVKGGRFAEHIFPARIYSVILSDIISSRPDMIASGPAAADLSTSEQALAIAEKYSLSLTPRQLELLSAETPKTVTNAQNIISGSVSELCRAARDAAASLGYSAYVMTDSMDCEARAAGELLGSMAATLSKSRSTPTALIFGGETVVRIRGNGKGGRNQELALAAAKYISGNERVAIFSVGSDGTDGPTDAAGGYVDGDSFSEIPELLGMLDNNDSHNALKKSGGLIFTGPTGTNVNDISVILIK